MADLHRWAREATRREACGLLLGEGGRVTAAKLAANVHPTPETHFEIDPAALIGAHRAARAGGTQVLGYWHSHPSGRAEPSAEDARQASGDERAWAIVAGGTITLWSDSPQGFVALSYIVTDG